MLNYGDQEGFPIPLYFKPSVIVLTGKELSDDNSVMTYSVLSVKCIGYYAIDAHPPGLCPLELVVP